LENQYEYTAQLREEATIQYA